ncbi:hypothetical protein G0Q02_16950 [Epibacterium mobile]|nr:hypothetical protein [Tritonibacter mobilis]NHM24554.1 hypothetical protein [Tritonibacter mobilis]
MGRPCAQTQNDTLRGLNIPAQFSKKSQWTQGTRARAISGYWPIKGEPELRPLIKELHDAGTEIVLPVVDAHAPLVLRRWIPATRMMAVIETSRFCPQTRPNERPTFDWPLAQAGARMAIGSDRVAATLIAHSQT